MHIKELVILKVEVACIGIIDTHQLHPLTRRAFKWVKHFIGSMANTPMKDIDTNLIPNTNRSIRGLLISILKILNQKTIKAPFIRRNVAQVEGSPAYSTHPGRANSLHISLIFNQSILGRFPFVRTDPPDHSRLKENFTFQQN